ncbi:MAG TPA: hypothetical protein VHD61_04910 [Lacunisphaera sp.]|nr:hypothetical protein [Lacunisphaera sp.]
MQDEFPFESPVEIVQPCSEACACFQPLADGGWSDYGLCTNPDSPYHGFPVRVGRECRDYRSTGTREGRRSTTGR